MQLKERSYENIYSIMPCSQTERFYCKLHCKFTNIFINRQKISVMFESINGAMFGCQDLTTLDNYITISEDSWCDIPQAKSITFDPDGEKIYMLDQHGETISKIPIEPEFDRNVNDGEFECITIWFGSKCCMDKMPFSDQFWRELRVLIDRMAYERNFPSDVKESAFFEDVDSEFEDLFSF